MVHSGVHEYYYYYASILNISPAQSVLPSAASRVLCTSGLVSGTDYIPSHAQKTSTSFFNVTTVATIHSLTINRSTTTWIWIGIVGRTITNLRQMCRWQETGDWERKYETDFDKNKGRECQGRTKLSIRRSNVRGSGHRGQMATGWLKDGHRFHKPGSEHKLERGWQIKNKLSDAFNLKRVMR